MQTMDYSLLLGIQHVTPGEENISDCGFYSYTKKEIYYVGIIDYLIEYGLAKKFERMGKSIYANYHEVSVCSVPEYAKRFNSLVSRIVTVPL